MFRVPSVPKVTFYPTVASTNAHNAVLDIHIYNEPLDGILPVREDARLKNLDLVQRPILRPRLDQPHLLDRLHTALDSSKDGMLPIQPGGGRERNKELAAIRVRPGIGHAEHAGAGVPQGRVDLVVELVAVDGGAAAAGAGGVAALDHEVGNDAVEDGGGVVAATDEGGEVVAGLGGVSGVELDGDGALWVRQG